MIEEVHGMPTRAGDTFSAAHVVGWFDDVDAMHVVAERWKGCTHLTADANGWTLS